jgi:uncharacterized membrane protein YfcA
MDTYWQDWLQRVALDEHVALIAITAIFVAGIVRGFTGFALSAVTVAILTPFIAPLELVPMCWFLEVTASLIMARGGWREADRPMVLGLIIGSAVGVVIGLWVTGWLDPTISKAVALTLLLVLAALQLAKVRARFLATKPGVLGAGLGAGLATGLAAIGGMVVALYVLARDAPAKRMRGSLVLYLLGSEVASGLALFAYGLMTEAVVARGLSFAVVAALGVFVGQTLFTPRFVSYYKPICLILLIGLAAIGLVRVL